MRVTYAGKYRQYRAMDEIVTAAEYSLRRIKHPGKGEAVYFKTAAPNTATYVPTEPLLFSAEVARMPELRPEFAFADLGSGVGRIVMLARLFHFARCVGFEADPDVCNVAQTIARGLGIDNVSFRHENFLQADLSPFDVLYLYKPFFDDFAPLVRKMVERRVAPGTFVLANVFYREAEEIFLSGGLCEPVFPAGVDESNVAAQFLRVFRKLG